MTTQAGRRLAQLLAVVGLLLGLVAMHGLASGHQSPTLVHVQSAGADAVDGQRHGAGQHGLALGAAAGPDAAAVPGLIAATPVGADSPCDGSCVEHLTVLCLAVLSAGAAVLAALVVRRTSPLPLPTLPPLVLPRPGPPLRLRPPDPVRDLCISRT